MHNFKLTLAYDGTDFHGWQIQPGQSTIQGTLTEVLEKLTQQRIIVCGAGRTDAGVHAVGQVANFKTESQLSAGDFQRACNALLAPSVRVIAAEEVSADFHARWDARGKTYRYRLHRGCIVSPFVWRYVHHDASALDFAAMEEAAPLFEGVHDFSTFAASSGSEEDDQEREMTRVIFGSRFYKRSVSHGEGLSGGWGNDVAEFAARPIAGFTEGPVVGFTQGSAAGCSQEEVEWVYEVRGKSFLRYMVRKMMGTLVDVGRGRLRPADIPELFAARDRSKSGATMPPQGLCLMKVEYSEPADEIAKASQ